MPDCVYTGEKFEFGVAFFADAMGGDGDEGFARGLVELGRVEFHRVRLGNRGADRGEGGGLGFDAGEDDFGFGGDAGIAEELEFAEDFSGSFGELGFDAGESGFE